MTRQPSTNSGHWGLAALAYTALIVYGSLYPFSGWTSEGVRLLAFLAPHGLGHLSRADVVTNVLAYMPLGLLIVRSLGPGRATLGAIAIATLIAGLLSFS